MSRKVYTSWTIFEAVNIIFVVNKTLYTGEKKIKNLFKKIIWIILGCWIWPSRDCRHNLWELANFWAKLPSDIFKAIFFVSTALFVVLVVLLQVPFMIPILFLADKAIWIERFWGLYFSDPVNFFETSIIPGYCQYCAGIENRSWKTGLKIFVLIGIVEF